MPLVSLNSHLLTDKVNYRKRLLRVTAQLNTEIVLADSQFICIMLQPIVIFFQSIIIPRAILGRIARNCSTLNPKNIGGKYGGGGGGL